MRGECVLEPIAKCPFYRKDDQNRVFCEGVIGSSGVSLHFANRQMMMDYAQRFCACNDYVACLIFRAANEKYEEK